MVARHADIVERAQRLVMTDLSVRWSTQELARACNTSASVLKTSFKLETGVPIYAWQRRMHMEAACQLMRSNPTRNIASIAADVGYSNPSKFTSAFESCMGTTPSQWRASHSPHQ